MSNCKVSYLTSLLTDTSMVGMAYISEYLFMFVCNKCLLSVSCELNFVDLKKEA